MIQITKIKLIMTILTFFVMNNANAYFFETEKSFEVFDPKIVISSANKGYATGKLCKDCKKQTFTVSKKTKAFNLKGKAVSLKKARSWSGKAVVFTYDLKTNALISIRKEFEVTE